MTIFNREQRRKMEQRYNKTELVSLIDESERKRLLITEQCRELEKIAAQETKETLSNVFNTITTALQSTVKFMDLGTDENRDLIVSNFMRELQQQMAKFKAIEEEHQEAIRKADATVNSVK